MASGEHGGCGGFGAEAGGCVVGAQSCGVDGDARVVVVVDLGDALTFVAAGLVVGEGADGSVVADRGWVRRALLASIRAVRIFRPADSLFRV